MDPISARMLMAAAAAGDAPETNGPSTISVRGIGGGGGGGSGTAGGSGYAGGGGAGEASVETNQAVTAAATYTITIGAGGSGATTETQGGDGSSTTLSGTGLSLTWLGGGGGGTSSFSAAIRLGNNGACGGGGAGRAAGGTGTGGTGSVGFDGGDATTGGGGGGGGMAQDGANAVGSWGGGGGNGLALVLNGDTLNCAGGGHGGGDTAASATTTYGNGIGALTSSTRAAGDGTANTGGGGGGGALSVGDGGSGGSGRVTISYPDTFDTALSVTGTYSFSQSGGYYFYDFTGDGTISFPAPSPDQYVEDVFSTYVYEGDGDSGTPGNSIVNGIDLAGEGGMVWIKNRDQADSYAVVDTERGVNKLLSTDTSAGESAATSVDAFNSDGFNLRSWAPDLVNVSGEDYASWTFRKVPGFFDVVTYGGNGVSGRTVAHNLGSAPGMIWVKRYDGTASWAVYHRGGGAPNYGTLNSTAAFAAGGAYWNNIEPTDTEFTLGSNVAVNGSGSNYVAYLFAHDDARFGDNNDQSIIKCGSYTGNGSGTGPVIDLGWEPQWVLIKGESTTGSWVVTDNIRGFTYKDLDKYFSVNTNGAEASSLAIASPLQNGFQVSTNSTAINGNGSTYIYMAIRRGPMKTPTDATTVFAAAAGANVTTAGDLAYNSGFPIDWIVEGWDTANYAYDRFMPTYDYLRPSETNVSAADGGFRSLVSNEGSPYDSTYNLPGNSAVGWCFRRAPGFFDMVAYTGTGQNRTVDHSLGVVPEMIWVKRLETATNWTCYNKTIGAGDYLFLDSDIAANTSAGAWNNTAPTSTNFTVGTAAQVNISSGIYHAYLFASLDGISKVGSYTGGHADISVDCGFSAGARFVMIKRTDTAGTWFVWDTTTGIVAGNDYYNRIDTGQRGGPADTLDPYSPGFTVVDDGSFHTLTAAGGTYIYLAIA